MEATKKREARARRRLRIRKRVNGTAVRPRLSVYRSNAHIYAQLIDDVAGVTLAAASSRDSDVQAGDKTAVARQVGQLVGRRAASAGITTCVFDRGGDRYAGRIAALAEGARESGLEF